ncbi:ribosome small subunit-dependent GTPase A [Candidatus Saccharibacteria bacterium]|nr:ribosome small subunit-dependent GTPase A [Candidatus Saccharibacteria bacterium]
MEDLPQLEALGYNNRFETIRVGLGAAVEQVARVTAEHKGVYEVMGVAGTHRAAVTGKRMLRALSRDDYPAVGDWVIIKNDVDSTKVIADILPRQTTLHKKRGGKDESQLIAANIDVALIVESTDRDYSLNRFERYLVLAREGGVKPVIVLNKADLYTEGAMAESVAAIRERFGDVDVLATSTVTNAGLQQLSDYIQAGLTYCFVGSSGVGKSSLINKLLRQDSIATTEISEKTGRGMHTTTARQMYFTATGGIIIDNPGSREVGVVGSTSGKVGEVFDDIDDLVKTCRFNNCSHTNEPGCAVQQALHVGTLNAARYANYQTLQKETKHHEMSRYDKRQKDRKFGKFIKTAKITKADFEKE